MAQEHQVNQFSVTEKCEAAQRELKYRERVYPRLVRAGKMNPDLAQRQIALMSAIADDYPAAADSEA